MLVLVSSAALAQMQTRTIEGKEVVTFIERSDRDGGVVHSTCELQDDGTYYCYREWRGRGILDTDASRDASEVEAEKLAAIEEAKSAFEGLKPEDVQNRVVKARDISGSLVMPETPTTSQR